MSAQKATNPTPKTSSPLSHLAQPAFSFILNILSGADLGDPGQLRANIGNVFAGMERRARETGIAAEDILTARFALTAFIDEAIARSDWSGRGIWAQNPLSLEYFSTNRAGTEFFDKLEALRLRPDATADLLEIYHTCLALGFEGKFALADPRQLQALTETSGRELARIHSVSADLSPHWEPPEQVFKQVRESLPLSVIAAGLVGIVFVFFLVLRFLGSGQATSIAAQLRALM
ncbi:MAG: type IVB secretion system protein IcmH/DotU [Candidatus Zixiibacteriota bacterium]